MASRLVHDLHSLGDGELKPEGQLAYVALAQLADVHIQSGLAFGSVDRGAVEGDALGVRRQREGQAAEIVFQPQHHIHGHEAIALGTHAANQIHLGGAALRPGRHSDDAGHQQAGRQQRKQTLQADSPSHSYRFYHFTMKLWKMQAVSHGDHALILRKYSRRSVIASQRSRWRGNPSSVQDLPSAEGTGMRIATPVCELARNDMEKVK